MLLKNTEKSPKQIKKLFQDLYEESSDLITRIQEFKNSFNQINDSNFPGKQSYQDDRAVIVYLSLRYPENYYIYKFTVFKEFANIIDYHYLPIGGRIENVGHFQNLCDLIKYELTKDQDLLKLHKDRISNDCYFDSNYNLLTQDFIYACTTYFNKSISKTKKQTSFHIGKIAFFDPAENKNPKITIDFSPSITNYIQREIDNKRIGDLGELWVIKYETERLIKYGIRNIADKIKHISKEKGDGAGFDIKSVDENSNEIYIEVKTTVGDLNTPFFITRQELERSILEKGRYFLYRVYNFDSEKNKADLLIVNGELSIFCNFPWTYKVSIKK
jgi:hypothetical protein